MTGPQAKRRVRLDVLLVERGHAQTREKAQALILAGVVSSEGCRLDKPGSQHPIDIPLTVAEGRTFVGRGARKLQPALAGFAIDPAGRDALDVGASTGGFTQVLLLSGATRVIALDVGHGQLDWSLRNDPRVWPLEGVNARHLTAAMLPFAPSIVTIDVSFISLRQVLAPTCACCSPGADVVALAKPQFEVGKGRVGKGGIVRDPLLWDQVISDVVSFARDHGLGPAGILRSAVAGASGNVEFFVHLRPGQPPAQDARLATMREEAIRAGA